MKFKFVIFLVLLLKTFHKIIQILLSAILFKFDEEFDPDTIYVKEYIPRSYNEGKPLGRTLFVAKIPLYLNENDVTKLFSEFGEVVSVQLHKNRPCDENLDTYINGFQCAHIVYKSRGSLLKVLCWKELKTLTDEKYTPIKGLVEEYYDSVYKQTKAIKELELYEEQKKEEELNKKNNEDEGWTVVGTKGRKPGIAAKLSEQFSHKKKKKQNKNFYTFQIKESKMKNLTVLMKEYEESKKKVAKMKQNRLFKPSQ